MRAPVMEYSCPRRWESLPGGDVRRFCAGCGKHVHNLSAMDPAAAQRFVSEHPDACLRFEADDRGRVAFRRRRLAIVAAAALAGCAGWETADELTTPADEPVAEQRDAATVPDAPTSRDARSLDERFAAAAEQERRSRRNGRGRRSDAMVVMGRWDWRNSRP